ncbi:MAG: hypothetical protein ACUVTZ_11130, partial [Armatimonadota bacterium]
PPRPRIIRRIDIRLPEASGSRSASKDHSGSFTVTTRREHSPSSDLVLDLTPHASQEHFPAHHPPTV